MKELQLLNEERDRGMSDDQARPNLVGRRYLYVSRAISHDMAQRRVPNYFFKTAEHDGESIRLKHIRPSWTTKC